THTSSHYINTPSLHDALPISRKVAICQVGTEVRISTQLHCCGHEYASGINCTNGGVCSLTRRKSDAVYRSHANIDSIQHLIQERSEEHTSELQSRGHLVCRLL